MIRSLWPWSTRSAPLCLLFSSRKGPSGSPEVHGRGKAEGRGAPARDDGRRSKKGTLSFLDNTIDTTTGTIQLKGTFPNRSKRLWPGQFVNTVLTLTVQPKAVVVPTKAIQTGQQGQYVFVVRHESYRRIHGRYRVDRTVGGESVISKGLNPARGLSSTASSSLSPGQRSDKGTSRPTATAAGENRHEHHRSLHPAPRHDDPGHAGHTPVRHSRLPASCGKRSARTSIFPPSVVSANLPGASAETMASSVATPLEKQFSTISRHRFDDIHKRPRDDEDHATVRPQPGHRRRRPGRADGHFPGEPKPAREHAQPAVPAQGEPCRRADPVHGAELSHPLPIRGQ